MCFSSLHSAPLSHPKPLFTASLGESGSLVQLWLPYVQPTSNDDLKVAFIFNKRSPEPITANWNI